MTGATVPAGRLGAPDLVLEGRFTDADLRRYVTVPFEVPAGLHQLHVGYTYSDRIDSDPLLSGGNTLDIGLFDPRGSGTGSPGFRGWSGSHKDEFVVGEGWATPPYLAGPILPGTWQVLLGPYKVGPRGLDWRVEVRFDPGLDAPDRDLVRVGKPTRPALPAARPGWLRGDLHCHTRYSDGDSWPAEMLHAGAEAGLDFLGVTDHNQVGHHAEYGPGGGAFPVVVPGVEVTTYGGHWNAWGTDRWWEFRTPEAAAVERAMAEAAASGAFVSVNHPKPFGPPWEYPGAAAMHAVEVWNGPWAGLNAASLEWWESLLARGLRVVAVGGSDTHLLRSIDPDLRHGRGLGTPTTWVEAGEGASAAAIVAAMRAGRTFVAASPAGPQLYLDGVAGAVARVGGRGGEGSALVVVADGAVVGARPVDPTAGDDARDGAEWSVEVRVPRSASYVRAQLVRTTGELLA
ncbi:MAG TPA: CehA/McbA family metallohydrolase, partial [Candidatus Limnocylindrales bacterium]|nr:CehA/McbA family metallohydrolase [Candidatus Limnocylindrales bacterium]